MAIIESIIAAFILYLISNIINNQLPDEHQISKKLHKISSAVSSVIIFGIILGIRCLFESLSVINGWFLIFNTDALSFVLMTTIFYFLYPKFVNIFERYRIEGENLNSSQFNKVFKIFIGLMWIIAAIFISIPLLGIDMRNPDIFNLGILWAALFVGFDIQITTLINKIRPIEKRIPTQVLKYSMFTGGLISFGIWSIQLIIFELYLKRLAGIDLFEQDIRVLIIVITVIYTITFFSILKAKFLPEASEKSMRKVYSIIELEEEQNYEIFDTQERVVEGVSLKTYIFLTKKGYKISYFSVLYFILLAYLLILLYNSYATLLLYIFLYFTLVYFAFLYLALKLAKIELTRIILKDFMGIISILGIFLNCISLFFLSFKLTNVSLPSNSFLDTIFLGLQSALIIVVIDNIISIIINLALPIKNRFPKDFLLKSFVIGGITSMGIWSFMFFILELVLNTLFGFSIVNRGIRMHIVVFTLIYFVSFLVSLKSKFLSEVPEERQKKLEEALQIIREEPPEFQEISEDNVILDVQNLTTYFHTEEGVVRAVEGVSFKIYKGEVLGLVGETGCGKSVTALSILQVIRPPGKIMKGEVIFRGENLSMKSESEMLKYRGRDITMIFQDPLNSLNPVFRIGNQIAEVFLLHMENELLIEAAKFPEKSIYSVAREWSIQLLRDLNIPFPEVIIDRYPHELSGGMRQRVQIAMALACSPKLLIADEPTTALDVTIQNQILKLMKDLKTKYNTSILFITHDLGIISKMCDRVAVMYSGYIVEYGDIKKLFIKPYHPYTKGLIASVPVVEKKREKLEVIRGMVPNLIYPPSGCRFHPRCDFCFEPCESKVPKEIEVEQEYFVACHLYDPQYKNLADISIKKVKDKIE